MELEIELSENSELPYESFIGSWQISNANLFCNGIIDYFENNIEIPKIKVNTNVKNDLEMCVFDTTNDYLNFFRRTLLLECYNKYCSKYKHCIAREISSSFIKIQKYEANQSYNSWHSERNNLDPMNISRHLVWMMYLNTIENGGETEFLYQKTKINPVAGKILIWPCDWTHTHRGIPSPSETKYIITGWFNHRILHEYNFQNL